MKRPQLFVSHIKEEARLAEILKTHLREDFLGMVDIFVSSDIDSIRTGDKWLETLEQALRETSALLVLCSPASINRPWVNFEVGAAWASSAPIVPICHSGLRPQDLPMPYSVLHSIEANSERGLRRTYSLVAEKLECDTPQKDFSLLISEVVDFELSNARLAGEYHTNDTRQSVDIVPISQKYYQIKNPDWEGVGFLDGDMYYGVYKVRDEAPDSIRGRWGVHRARFFEQDNKFEVFGLELNETEILCKFKPDVAWLRTRS